LGTGVSLPVQRGRQVERRRGSLPSAIT
jgi:hypothetical protein